MPTIVLTRQAARYLVDAALSACSRDDLTPSICGAHISLEGDMLRVVATDRYRVHTTTVKLHSFNGDPAAILPLEALEWLRTNAAYFGRNAEILQRIRIDVEPHPEAPEFGLRYPGKLTITVMQSDLDDADTVSWSGRHTRGNFPPVMNLIETARKAEAITATPRLRLDYVAKVQRLTRKAHQPVRQKFTTGGNPNKPGPVYFAVEEDGVVVAEALLQPQLEPR